MVRAREPDGSDIDGGITAAAARFSCFQRHAARRLPRNALAARLPLSGMSSESIESTFEEKEGTTMKSLTSKLMVAAMAMGAVASVASAQVMKSEVPFPFRVAGTVMPAGSYQITDEHSRGGTPIFRLVNTDVNRPVLALPNGHMGALYG